MINWVNIVLMKKDNKKVIYWLLTGCTIIYVMVVVGGITRLTHSGLSISNYKLISGTIPPIGEAQWQEAFEMKKEDYIRSKQIDWFYIPGGEPNFLGPIEVEDVLEGKKYLKDANWSPSVTTDDIKTHFQ